MLRKPMSKTVALASYLSQEDQGHHSQCCCTSPSLRQWVNAAAQYHLSAGSGWMSQGRARILHCGVGRGRVPCFSEHTVLSNAGLLWVNDRNGRGRSEVGRWLLRDFLDSSACNLPPATQLPHHHLRVAD